MLIDGMGHDLPKQVWPQIVTAIAALTRPPNDGRSHPHDAGSLPRPPELVALHARRFAGERIDATELAQRSKQATEALVRRQVDIGADQVNNGEVGRVSSRTCSIGWILGQSRRPPCAAS